jgi:2-methylisocitrate lyase-like PEP mutase family enzyme
MTTASQRIAAYRALHEKGLFIQPNPWDRGTARYLRGRGYKALATTSAGYAWALGLPDQVLPVEDVLAHVRDLVETVPDLPINVDFENGYADDLDGLSRNVIACIETGIAGLSIEDATGNPAAPLYDFNTALQRVKAARKAVDKTGSGVLLTARAEAFLHGHPTPLSEACKRLSAFADAGADVLYAPGAKTEADISAIVEAAQGKPINVVVFAGFPVPLPRLKELGVRRVSLGATLAKAAFSAFVASVDAIESDGPLNFGALLPSPKINGFFEADMRERNGS